MTVDRAIIGYFIEGVLPLLLFAKEADAIVDALRMMMLTCLLTPSGTYTSHDLHAFGLANMDCKRRECTAWRRRGGFDAASSEGALTGASIDTGLVAHRALLPHRESANIKPVIESVVVCSISLWETRLSIATTTKAPSRANPLALGSPWSQKRRQARCSLQRKLLLVACYPRIWGNVRRNFFLMRSREVVASIRQHSPWRSC